MTTKLTKEQLAKLPAYKPEAAAASRSSAVQHLEIVSTAGNTIRVVAAVPGSVGYSPDGEITFEYSAISHFTHTTAKPAIVNLNHHQDEIIGAITHSEADPEGQLINDITIADKFDFFVPIVLSNRHEGVSIEAIIKAGVWLSDRRVLVTEYELTGIAVLFTKPPACDKEICRVISADMNHNREHLAIHDLLSKIDGMTDDEIKASFLKVEAEIAERTKHTHSLS
jgi:hypothetical protein